ncbi:MAG: hypothetical protein LAP87_19560 [Acidobacteriia bacterium]|nr:hypothetical protein [Terriglobia bacterium]
MFCHRCGTQVAPDLQFCPNCGQSFAAAPGIWGSPPVAWTAPSGIEARTGRWIGAGWQMVKADIGMYFVLALVMSLVSSMVPVILHGPLLAGFHIFCMKKILGRRAEFADLFTGFNFFVPTLVASLLISLFVSIGFILCIIPGLVLTAMYMFTYLFIVDKRMDFWPAMQASHAVVKNDYFGFTMYVLVSLLVLLLGVICCVVGVFVAIPVVIAATTVAYQEIVGFEPRTAATL